MDLRLDLVVGRGDVVEKAAEVVGGEERFGGFIWRCFGRFSGFLP